MPGPITAASLPGSAIDAPVPNVPGAGVPNLPPGPIPQLNLQAFGATPLPVQNFLNAQPQGPSVSDLAQALVASTSPVKSAPGNVVGGNGGESFVSHVMDLLNIGNYATATAAEQGIDAKNRDLHNGDNFLQAAADTAWNTVLGFGHGIAGAFGDSRPGDKTDWSDVWMKHGPDAAILNGSQTTMPDYAQNEANQFLNAKDGGHRPTDLTRPITADDIKKIAITNGLAGTAMDIFADPVNVLGLGSAAYQGVKNGFKSMDLGGKLKAAQGLSKAPETADAVENLLKDYKTPQEWNGVNKGQLIRPGEKGPVANTVAKAAVQDSAATGQPLEVAPNVAPIGPADVLKASGAAGKIDPDFFNQLMQENMHTAEPTPPVAAEPAIAPGAYSQLRDPALRDAYVGKLIKQVVGNGEGGAGWVYKVMAHVSSKYEGIDKFDRTAAYLTRMGKQIPALDKAPAPVIAKVREALSKTLEADVEAHVAANKAIKAPELIQRAQQGDPVATEAVKLGNRILPKLSPNDAQIVADVVNKYTGQLIHKEAPTFSGDPVEQALKAAKYNRAVAEGRTAVWNGVKQVNIYDTIKSRLLEANPNMGIVAAISKAHGLLQHVEAHFLNQGLTPFSSADMRHSVPLLLSDVLAKIPSKILADHKDYLTVTLRSAFSQAGMVKSTHAELKDAIDQAMEAGKAGAAISEAPKAKLATDKLEQIIQAAKDSGQSDARVAEAVTTAEKAAQDITAQAGGAASTGNSVRSLIRQAYIDSDTYQSAVDKSFPKTLAAMAADNIVKNTSSVENVNKALSKILGGPPINNLGRLFGPQANALGWMGGRQAGAYGLLGGGVGHMLDWLAGAFNPAWRNERLRPMLVQYFATPRAIVARDARIYNGLSRQLAHDPETLRAGWLAAQGHKLAPEGSDAAKWAQQFTKHMEDMVGSSSLKTAGLLSNTVAGRAQILRKELNASAKRFGLPGEFTNAKDVKDAMGVTHDYSKGVDWLKSWESWDVKGDPREFMMRMSNTVRHAVFEAKFWEEMASRHGKPGVSIFKDSPRLRGYYFDPDIAAEVRTVQKFVNDFKKPNSKAERLIDGALAKYKTAATMYLPAHHMRALMGDVSLSWMAGVEDVSAYSASRKILAAQRGRYNDFGNLHDLTGEDAVANAMARAKGLAPVAANVAKGTDTIFTMKNGMHVTADMIYTYMFHHGNLPSAGHLMDIPEEDALAKMMAPFNNKVHDFVHGAAELREHYIRIAHFVDSMKKAGNVSFEEAAAKASADVRKWHPDGTDLTTFERKVMRRVFPFYSWTRKAVPLVLESLLARPGKVMLYPRAMHMIGVATGAQNPQDTSTTDQFPTDQLFPNWLEEKGIGPTLGGPGGYISINPNIPTMDILETIGGLTSPDASERGNAWSSWLNPLGRVPLELTTGQTLGGSAILSRKSGYGEYLLNQLPQVQQYTGIDNITSTDPNQPAGTLNIPKLLNFLGAMGVHNDNQYNKQAMYDFMNNQRISAGTGF